MELPDIETPAILVDLDVMEENISKMSVYVKGKNITYRPHVKAHKSPFIASKQLAAGGRGICCQTLGEAEAMAASGIDDIFITNQIASPEKIEKLTSLCKHAHISVAVDDLSNAKALSNSATGKSAKLGVLIEVNVGLDRCGVEPGEPALSLAKQIVRLPGLEFKGLMGYEGHLQVSIPEFEKRKQECHRSMSLLLSTRDLLEDASVSVKTVSGGGTGTYNITGEYPGVTEIQPGSYVYMDHKYRTIDTCGRDFAVALTYLSTVISRPAPDRAVIDLGWKSFGVEYGLPIPKDLDGAEYMTRGDEHGVLALRNPSRQVKIGDKLELIPAHCDTTVNLFDKFYGIRDDQVELVCDIPARRK